MPYISDAERERARWMTLTELIAHVEREGCDRSAALKQIRNALGDRKLRIKWEKEPLRLSQYILYAHQPPEGASFWQQADIGGDAKVLDPETENRRTLLILKDDVFELWPVPSVAAAASESGKVGPTIKAKDRGRPIACNDVHQAADRLSQQGRKLKDMPQKEREALVVEASGKCLRTVQKYLPSWLENQRADA
jgi:hypothetical protein